MSTAPTNGHKRVVRGGFDRASAVHDEVMKPSRTIVVLDAPDLDPESTFWAGLLDGTVEASHDDWHTVRFDAAWTIGIQLAPDHVPPDWPDGAPQQVHLDFYVDDLATAHDQAMALGARLLQAAEDPDASSGFQVYADPAGHPFCLCWD